MSYKFVIKQQFLSQELNTVLCYEDDGIPTAETARQLCQAIVDKWETNLVPFLVPEWSTTSVEWTHTNALPGEPAQPLVITQLPLAGTAAGTPMPVQTAVYVAAKTIGGPPWRGGTYISGWNNSLLGQDGLVQQNRVDALLAFFDDIKTLPAISIGNVARVIVSYGSKTAPVGTAAPVQTNVVNRNPSHLDKRRIGVGS